MKAEAIALRYVAANIHKSTAASGADLKNRCGIRSTGALSFALALISLGALL
jgi:hypothetical protein